MKILFLIFLSLCTNVVLSQPVPKNKILTFGFYDSKGKLITPQDKNILINFFFDNYSDSIKGKVTLSKREIEYSSNRFKIETWRKEQVVITILNENKKMIIHTSSSIDSIRFKEGEYEIDFRIASLFQINTYNKTKITNFDINNFKTNSAYKIPEVTSEQMDVNPIKEPKSVNIDNNTLSRINQITNKPDYEQIRVIVYQLENIFIKEEFNTINNYTHSFSISYDSCRTWTKHIEFKYEWYVDLIYFPQIERVGILYSDILLISDYKMKEWFYYASSTDDKITTNKIIGVIPHNRNWSDNECLSFQFLPPIILNDKK